MAILFRKQAFSSAGKNLMLPPDHGKWLDYD
jgi:hypothetical protein